MCVDVLRHLCDGVRAATTAVDALVSVCVIAQFGKRSNYRLG